jgi:hypothetical protein
MIMSQASLIAMSAALAVLIGTVNSPASAALVANALTNNALANNALTNNGVKTSGAQSVDSLNGVVVESVILPTDTGR